MATLEEKVKGASPDLAKRIRIAARRSGTTFREALCRYVESLPRPEDTQTLKARFPELYTIEEVNRVLDFGTQGRITIKDDGGLEITGQVAQLISAGPDGVITLSDMVRAYAPTYVRQMFRRVILPRLSLGTFRIPEDSGIKQFSGLLPPREAILFQTRLYMGSGQYTDQQFAQDRLDHFVLSFAHHIQTSRTLDEVVHGIAGDSQHSGLDGIQRAFGTADVGGIVQQAITRVQELAQDWSRYARNYTNPKTGTVSLFPSLHQYLRGRLLQDYRRMLFWDCTGSGKTGSIATGHFLLDEQVHAEHQRGTRTLVIAPTQPSVSVWTRKEINGYTEALGIEKQRIVHLIIPPDYLPQDYDAGKDHSGEIKRQYAIEAVKRKLKKVKRGGIIVIGDGKLSYKKGELNPYIAALTGDDFRGYFDMVAVDECQIVKNTSNRTSGALNVLRANEDALRVVASATPGERDLNDFRRVLQVLNHQIIQEQEVSALDLYRDPNAAREILHRRAFTFTYDDLKLSGRIPECEVRDYMADISDCLTQRYVDKWHEMNAIDPSDPDWIRKVKGIGGIHSLVQILFEGKMTGTINRYYQQGQQGPEEHHNTIADFIGARAQTDQLIIYVRYKDHVKKVAHILRGLDVDYIKLTGDQDAKKRERKLERLFRTGTKRAAIVTQQSMEVGVKMISYVGNPITVMLLDPPQSTGKYEQLIGRAYRQGQSGKVTVARFWSSFTDAEDKVRDALSGIRQLHPNLTIDDDKIVNGFAPIDTTTWRIVDPTLRIFAALRDRGNNEDLRPLLGGSRSNNYGLDVHNGVLRMIRMDSEHRIATNFFKEYNGRDYEELREAQKLAEKDGGAAWSNVIKFYEHKWRFSASGYTAFFIADICNRLRQEKGLKFERRADLGSGAAYYSRAFNESFDCIDMDHLFLRMGKTIVKDIVDKNPGSNLNNNRYIQSTIQQVPLNFTPPKQGEEDKRYDLVIAAYVWQYQAQRYHTGKKKTLRQLEDALIEANRIMQIGGYMFAPVPRSKVSDVAFNRICTAAAHYGFESTSLSDSYIPQKCRRVHTDDSGAEHETEITMPQGGSARGFKMFVFRKVREYTPRSPDDRYAPGATHDMFALYPEERFGFAYGRGRQAGGGGSGGPRPDPPPTIFADYVPANGISLDDRIKAL